MTPASAERSLRGHGTVTAVASAAQPASGPAITTRVGGPPPRPDPGAPAPPVTVMRIRASGTPAALTTSSTTSRSARSDSGTSRPRRSAPDRSRSRWRRTANGRPPIVRRVSNTPSPTVNPWSNTEIDAAPGSTSAPSIHTAVPCCAMAACKRTRPVGVEPDAGTLRASDRGMVMRGWMRGVATAVATVALAGCWPAPGQGPDGQGYNPFETRLTIDNVTTLTPEWEVPVGGFDLVAADGVLVGIGGGGLNSYDIATGAPMWSKRLGHQYAFFRPAVLQGGAAYAPHTLVGTDTSVYDLQTGQDIAGTGFSGGVVAFRGDDILLEDARFDPSFTHGIWSFLVLDGAGSQWGGVTHIQPPFSNEVVNTTLGIDRVYSSGYGLMSTAPGDGTSGVGVRAFGPELPATCGPVDNPVYACPQWVTPIDGVVTTPVVIGPGGATLYVATDAGTVYALDATTGAVRWSAALGAPIVERRRWPRAGCTCRCRRAMSRSSRPTAAVRPRARRSGRRPPPGSSRRNRPWPAASSTWVRTPGLCSPSTPPGAAPRRARRCGVSPWGAP